MVTHRERERAEDIAGDLEVRWEDPSDLHQCHPARDEDRLNELTESMRERGWDGIPLLVEGRWSLVTGNHRIEAARRAGIDEVPTVKIEDVIRSLGADPDDYRMGDGRIDTDALYRIDGMDYWGEEWS